MKKNKYLDKYAVVTTKTKKFNIMKIRLFIGGKINYYGKQYIIVPENEKADEIRIIDDIYSLDSNRLRFLSDTIKNPVIFDTIEHSPDHSSERPIKVIQDYDDVYTEITSIPEIVKFESDLIIYEKDKILSKTEENKKKNNGGFFLTLKKKNRDAA